MGRWCRLRGAAAATSLRAQILAEAESKPRRHPLWLGFPDITASRYDTILSITQPFRRQPPPPCGAQVARSAAEGAAAVATRALPYRDLTPGLRLTNGEDLPQNVMGLPMYNR
ncbi:hypothetical protein VOLCADRAFT_98399 [Volvox carteri f. nagariensis]|uniref:Uncharacterized protein n=1 Tax=Volvox carteri f. nagariensis TaxID=3068 RepID=D8UF87_VOLCA|nr:uncharacterized protein VOLCADRAFT_98399 [Volvox carteri f. nagariensis]EFJ41672.1 hypothetical protein VOLCADRAFT_98399 [Volvox carteri f. nagariensis]|eukprot:XP_002957328.1 hypothetical protein VOLCADRAFT_98399 [Volvox carteri f. nagariensis]